MPEGPLRRNAPRALVVDDDPVIRLLAAQALATLGFQVEEAEDGESALAAVDRAAPDLVMLDVEMPGLDGFETCAALRQRPHGREIPVLVATGHTDVETIDEAFRVGATDFIKKPLDWQILQHRVRFVMRASHAFSELRSTLSDLRQSQERLANAQRIARIGNWEWTPGETEMLWSEELHRIFGVEPGPGASSYAAFLAVVHPDDRERLEKAMQAALCESKAWSLEHRIVSFSSQHRRVVQHQAEVARGPDGTPERLYGIVQDVTESRQAAERIRHLSYYDSVTALPNRRMLSDYLKGLLEQAARQQEPLALLHLSLDRFKRINETLGPTLADRLLRAVATRLSGRVRTTDSVGRLQDMEPAKVSRLGGDEFAIVLHVIRSANDAAHVAARVLESLREPFRIEGHDLVLTASLGIAVYPGDGTTPETLMRSANAAMHHAKSVRNAYRFFSEAMNESALRNLRLENALRGAAIRGELLLLYQPQLETRTDRLISAEALVRWRSPEFGLVSPGEFIPLAEQTGLIEPIGEWVLEAACAQLRAWRAAGLAPLRVAANVSSHQVRRPQLVDTVARLLQQYAVDPSCLELEITESALLADEPVVIKTLQGLKALGVRLALDDFGTGFSSLSHLVRFPIDAVKIDRLFVSDIDSGGQGVGIVAAVLAMARRLELTVTAEGVETAEQAAYLRREGCDFLQGYLLGRPEEPAALAERLRKTSSGT